MVKRPKCRLCGHEHYTHEPHEFDDAKPKRADNPLADKPTKVKDDQPMARAAAMTQAIERINELEAEVRVLKKELAKRAAVDTTVASTAKECPTCKARREAKTAAQKKWRGGVKSKSSARIAEPI